MRRNGSMKKILTLLAVMVAMLASCNKNEIEPVSKNDGKDIVLNIRVSNPGADDTKALIKTGWAANDEISIWYDSNVQETPDLVVTYNGEKWIQKEGAVISGNTPSTGTGKYAKALYNGKVKVASKDSYTYDGTTLTFNIANWKFLTEIQVVVYGDDIDGTKPSDYTLSCDKFTPCTGYNVGPEAITASAGTINTAVTGISNSDGVAFVFATAEYSKTATDFIFTLTNNTSSSAVVKKYTPSNPLPENKSVIKAIKIASNKFVAPTRASSVAEANNFIGTNEENAKSVDLTSADITSGDVAADNTVHLVLKATSPSDMVSFALPAIPGGLGCTGWTIMSEMGYPTEKVIVNAPAGSSITIQAPTSHVILTGTSYASINARTGYNTFVVPSGVTIANLTVEQGAVEIHGTVNALTVSPVQGENVLFRSCEGLSQTVFDKIKGTDHIYIDPSYEAVQNNGAWDIVLKPIDIHVTAVSLSGFPEGNTIFAGTSVTLTATVAPADATNKNLIWKSNNNAVATVDQNGKVTGVAPGSANITVTTVDGCKTATCAITVTETSLGGNPNNDPWSNGSDSGFNIGDDD